MYGINQTTIFQLIHLKVVKHICVCYKPDDNIPTHSFNKTLETPSAGLSTESQWMTFSERVRFQKELQPYKIINNICPKYLQNYFTFTNEFYSKNIIRVMLF